MNVEKIKEILNQLGEIEVDSLERKGTDFPFSDVQKHIVTILESIKILKDNPEIFEQLPFYPDNHIENFFDAFQNNVRNIQKFNPAKVGNPGRTRDIFAGNIRSSYAEFYSLLFPCLKFAALEREVSPEKMKELEQQGQKVIDEVRRQKEEVNETLNIVQEAAAVAGVSRFAGVFGDQAQKNRRTARTWLIVSIVSVGIIGFIIWWIFDGLVDERQSEIASEISWQIFLSKILFLSFASVVFYQVVKNYNANMHLYTLNKHRENSLATFQAFVESSKDYQVRETILVQTTRAIFEAGQTGYVSSPDGAMPSIETIKLNRD
ncbi:MAG: hypothetical protein OXU50_08235 [Gammaproteobacteria bacterium]|nr:hypothetical protein [Gammaproteobacteria bacterium]